MNTLTTEDRARWREARIVELKKEISDLIAEEAAANGLSHEETIQQCRDLVTQGKRNQAIQHYRNHMGCGLKEAFYAIERL